jgi:hyperosmotically inducible periplasmic protein
MKKNLVRLALIGLLSISTVAVFSGCAVTRGQEKTGEYIDDSVVTTQIKARWANNKDVSALALHVETLKGEVTLSGNAKSASERATAEGIAREIHGVKSVRNTIVVRP